MKNERLHALKILTSLMRDHLSLSQLMPASAEVSPMTKEICFGFCRHYFRLQAMANLLMDKKPKDLEVWIAILMGLYQLHYMRQPDYAVVKETVALLEKIKKGWAKGLVNGVLRTFCRKVDVLLSQLNTNVEFIYGHPKWLLDRIQHDWPTEWQNVLVANDAHPPMTLRVNLKKTTVSDYLVRLQEAEIDARPHPVAPEAIILTAPCDVRTLPGFIEGEVSVQDAAAQLAPSLLALQPGQRVLDACAAPGGKTCHILEAQPKLAECVALDVDPKRIERVKENLNRLQLTATILQGDASCVSTWWDGRAFDRILLDAPCSATGVIRRHSDIKLLRTQDEISAVIKVQEKLLHTLWPLLLPGGVMVYATCSIMADENAKQIRNFLNNHSDCTLVNNPTSWGVATDYGKQILPGEHNMDGFFYAVLVKDKK